METFRGIFKESKEEGIYSVPAIANFYGGKYYEQGIDTFFVLASSPEEAKKIAGDNVDVVDKMFRNKKYKNKNAISKRDKVKVKIGTSKPKLTSNRKYRNTLTKNGIFELVDLDKEK